MEVLTIVSIISAVTALIISVLTHIKKSSCNNKGLEIITTDNKTPTQTENKSLLLTI